MQHVWLIPLDSLKCHFVISTLSHSQLALQLQQRTHCILCIKYSGEHFLSGRHNLSSRQQLKDINIESVELEVYKATLLVVGHAEQVDWWKRGKCNFSLLMFCAFLSKINATLQQLISPLRLHLCSNHVSATSIQPFLSCCEKTWTGGFVPFVNLLHYISLKPCRGFSPSQTHSLTSCADSKLQEKGFSRLATVCSGRNFIKRLRRGS